MFLARNQWCWNRAGNFSTTHGLGSALALARTNLEHASIAHGCMCRKEKESLSQQQAIR
jgi:hypothetical protein